MSDTGALATAMLMACLCSAGVRKSHFTDIPKSGRVDLLLA